jgi:hypothetical protein
VRMVPELEPFTGAGEGTDPGLHHRGRVDIDLQPMLSSGQMSR